MAVGGTATSLRRLVGAELAHETLERGIRVLSLTPIDDVAARFELDPERVRLLPAGHPRARGAVRPARAAASDSPRRPARGRDPRAARGQGAGVTGRAYSASSASSRGRRSTRSSPLFTAASPPFFIRTWAPVRLWIAIEKSGSWPTSITLVAVGSGQSLGVEGTTAQRSLERHLHAVELVAGQARGVGGPDLGARDAGVQLDTRALSAAPAARACSSPRSVSGRSASGDPSPPRRAEEPDHLSGHYPVGSSVSEMVHNLDTEAPAPRPSRRPSSTRDRALHQPRALVARLQRARARSWPRTSACRCSSASSSSRSTATNLDEFFMVRVAGLHDQVDAGIDARGPDGLTPAETIERIAERARELERAPLARLCDATCVPSWPRQGIRIVELRGVRRRRSSRRSTALFAEEIFPVLTPLAVGPGRPFPYISNLSLSLAVLAARPGLTATRRSRA